MNEIGFDFPVQTLGFSLNPEGFKLLVIIPQLIKVDIKCAKLRKSRCSSNIKGRLVQKIKIVQEFK
jgi:hypothetical protein